MALKLIKASTAYENTNAVVQKLANEKRTRAETWLNSIFNTSLSESMARGQYSMTLEVPETIDSKTVVDILKNELGYHIRWGGARGKGPPSYLRMLG